MGEPFFAMVQRRTERSPEACWRYLTGDAPRSRGRRLRLTHLCANDPLPSAMAFETWIGIGLRRLRNRLAR
jgi:hypothetical protein